MNITPVYLDSYTLQSDMRIRLPKALISNLNGIPGTTRFDFYFDAQKNIIIMRLCDKNKDFCTTKAKERG